MVLLWPLAPLSVAWLCAAQLLSGLFMTTLEGLLDATTAARATGSVTGALARGTAGRALGSAAGTAALPVALVGVGLAPVTGGVTLLLAGTAVAVFAGTHLAGSRSQRHAPARHRAHAIPSPRGTAAGPRTGSASVPLPSAIVLPVPGRRRANGHWPEPGLAAERLPAQPLPAARHAALPHPWANGGGPRISMPPLRCGRRLHAGEVDRPVGCVRGDRLAGVPVERLAAARACAGTAVGAVARQTMKACGTPRARRPSHRRAMRCSAPSMCMRISPSRTYMRLVGVGVGVQRRDLALRPSVLEQQEGAVGLLGGRLPGVDAAAEEPAPRRPRRRPG